MDIDFQRFITAVYKAVPKPKPPFPEWWQPYFDDLHRLYYKQPKH